MHPIVEDCNPSQYKIDNHENLHRLIKTLRSQCSDKERQIMDLILEIQRLKASYQGDIRY